MKIELSTEMNPCPEYFGVCDTILDIRTSTNFWRTSQLLESDLILSDGKEIRKLNLTSEKESDEYDMLLELASALTDTKRLITFSGTGFDLPHLKKKYTAYRTKCPLEEPDHIDLRGELRKYSSVLPVPTHKLKDYYSLVSSSEDLRSDAEQTLAILPLLGLNGFFHGQFSLSEIIPGQDSVVFFLGADLPCRIQYSDEVFLLEGEDRSVKVRARLYDGSLRLYHTDYQNYMYLPFEGYAVHKTLASYIASSRKVPAERETSFSCIPFGQKFIEDRDKAKKYLDTVLKYAVSR